MVERFFRDITTERLRRGVFTSVSELVKALDEYVDFQANDAGQNCWAFANSSAHTVTKPPNEQPTRSNA
jgi:hypothetical protein